MREGDRTLRHLLGSLRGLHTHGHTIDAHRWSSSVRQVPSTFRRNTETPNSVDSLPKVCFRVPSASAFLVLHLFSRMLSIHPYSKLHSRGSFVCLLIWFLCSSFCKNNPSPLLPSSNRSFFSILVLEKKLQSTRCSTRWRPSCSRWPMNTTTFIIFPNVWFSSSMGVTLTTAPPCNLNYTMSKVSRVHVTKCISLSTNTTTASYM